MTDRTEREASDGPPQSRDTIPAALIAACERLCSTRPPSEVSVRDIAAEAAVTPGLVHHYFESKDALVAETLRSISVEIDASAEAAVRDGDDPGAVARAAWDFMQQRPAFAYIVAWWLLEGRDVTSAMRDHPFLRRLVMTLPGADPQERATRAGVIVSAIIGGTVFQDGINRALGRATDDPAIAAALGTAVEDLAGRE